ncbi:MAG: hypothetical protein ACI84B_001692, partial [Oceanospirillaceae bacterium]
SIFFKERDVCLMSRREGRVHRINHNRLPT